MKTFFILVLFIPVCLFFSCMKKKTTKSLPDTVSFSRDIQPLFNASCITSGCHNSSAPAAGLSLEATVAYSQLFKKNEIDTTNADGSELYRELATGTMPKGSKRLDDYSVNLVEKWIQQKAKNN